jgi:hypothetical protein
VLAGPDLGAGLESLIADAGGAGSDDVALLAVRFHAQD